MARKSKEKTEAVEIMPGTQEFATREFLAREKAAYEERTGEKVAWEPDHPLTSTPLAVEVERPETGDESQEEEGDAQGDDE